MNIVDQYITRLNLKNITKTTTGYNARCPICGDSKYNKTKKRFFIIKTEKSANAYCHNCGYSESFYKLLQDHYSSIFADYKKELFKSKITHKRNHIITEKSESVKKIEKRIETLSEFSNATNHISKEFINNRKLLSNFSSQLYYSDNFLEWANNKNFIKTKYIPKSDPRIVIPFIKNGIINYIQGRTLINSKMRYVTIAINKQEPKLWNVDNINKNKTCFITEGPIDGSFINNCISFASSNIDLKYLKNNFDLSKTVYIFDNDIYYNDQLKKIAVKYIKNGLGIAFFSRKFLKYKDINEMIQAGFSVEDINNELNNNIYFDKKAILKLKLLRN